MEQSEERGESTSQTAHVTPTQAIAPSPAQAMGTTSAYVYAMGRIMPRFPSLGVEKEFAQAIRRTNTADAKTTDLTDRQVLKSVLSERLNRYLARQVCWVFEIEGQETYLLVPRDPVDFDLLVETFRATPSPLDVDVVVGVRGPIAPPEVCNSLQIPMVIFDQIYYFDRHALIQDIPPPEGMTAERFEPMAEALFDRILYMADNAGASDEHRALNYLATRYPPIYAATAEAFARNSSLTGVEVRSSRLSGVRKIVDVIFSYADRATDVTEKFFVRVDVTEEFPFMVTKLSPYYER